MRSNKNENNLRNLKTNAEPLTREGAEHEHEKVNWITVPLMKILIAKERKLAKNCFSFLI
jgi:hypothetical protein